MVGLPPGPRLPATLQVLRWIRSPTVFMEECARRFGDCFTLRFPANPPLVFFSDPGAVREIFAGDPQRLRAGEANVILRPLLGESSLLLLDGSRHRAERKLLMPPFHGERMQASPLPQILSAMAIVHARSGGLEKYPKANSRDQTQYCDSSK